MAQLITHQKLFPLFRDVRSEQCLTKLNMPWPLQQLHPSPLLLLHHLLLHLRAHLVPRPLPLLTAAPMLVTLVATTAATAPVTEDATAAAAVTTARLPGPLSTTHGVGQSTCGLAAPLLRPASALAPPTLAPLHHSSRRWSLVHRCLAPWRPTVLHHLSYRRDFSFPSQACSLLRCRPHHINSQPSPCAILTHLPVRSARLH